MTAQRTDRKAVDISSPEPTSNIDACRNRAQKGGDEMDKPKKQPPDLKPNMDPVPEKQPPSD